MFKRKLKQFLQDESSGEVMLESTIIVFFTIVILMAMISLGFLFYQRIAVSLVANDIAGEIAAAYKTSDADKQGEVAMYRTSFNMLEVEEKQRDNATELLKQKLPLVSLGFDTEAKVSNFDIIVDNVGRMHVEATVDVECDILFSGVLEYTGIIDSKPSFTAVGRAECLDVTAYAGHVKFFQYASGKLGDSKTGEAVDDILDIADSFSNILSIFGLE